MTDIYGEHWRIEGNKVMEEKAMKFKVGDKVRIVGNSFSEYYDSHEFNIGDIVTVEDVFDDNDQPYYCKDSDGHMWWVTEDDIEKVEEKAMKFKVGDKVTIKSKAEIIKAYGDVDAMPGGWVESMNKYCGKTGEIVDEYADRVEVIFNDSSHWSCGAKALTPAVSTVTITFNGDTTTATDGEHTATVTKYHDDEYSEETGAIEAIKKLCHRFPQVGDRYYLVFIGSEGAHVEFNNFDDDPHDNAYRDSGNFYETREAAQKVADKINAIFKEEH